MVFKRDEIRTLIGVAIGFPAVVGTGWWLWGAVVIVPALTVAFVSLLAVAFGSMRRLRYDIEDSLRQVQGLLYLNAHLHTPVPLPTLGGAALTPESAAMLIGLIREQRPRLIVELGSGVSTLICAHTLKQLGEGRVISLDHDAFYGDITKENVRRHGLEDWADVRHAPIEPKSIEGQDWQWYATSQLPADAQIDLLIVDGPPRGVQKLARYPAAKVLFDRLSPNCTIVMDDTNRKDEREIVRLWTQELSEFEVSEHPAGKGATIFRRAA